jgi:PTS system mannose-specific IIB component/fructoselysine and glucoselysine-specific PTS system IIB component
MAIVLCRIDDRLIHGQVVVGWGQPLGIQFIVLVDDEVAASTWEQELYRMGVPPGVDVYFHRIDEMPARYADYTLDPRRGVLLTASVSAMHQLAAVVPSITEVNVGGVHHATGRTQRLRYVFLTTEEEALLQQLATRGVRVTARDVPTARAVPLDELLANAASF